MIYFIRSGKKGPIKIGYTGNDVNQRMSDLQVGNPFKLYLVGYMPGEISKETELHQMFKDDCLKGEWFKPSFILSKYIIENCEVAPVATDDIKFGIDLDSILRNVETEYIMKALELSGGNKNKAAYILGMTFRSFRYRIKKNGIGSWKQYKTGHIEYPTRTITRAFC